MQAILEDPLAFGMLIFGVFLNLAALGMRWQKEFALKNQARAQSNRS
jgi:hypothetical protein